MSNLLSKVVRPAFIACMVVAATSASAQQDFPTKPIRMIVPFPPGGATNVVARVVAQKLQDAWGQSVIVDNRPGGNTIIGTEALMKAPADGYTIEMVLNNFVITPLLQSAPYDPLRDFAPVAIVASGEILLAIHPSVPAKNLQELIALAKARPGELNYASAGNGTPLHLSAESFNQLAEVKIQNVPYKGGGPALADLLGGQVQMQFSGPLSALPHVQTGKLRAIAFSGPKRFSGLPDVPTFAEQGLPAYNAAFWFGIIAPAGTPKPIVDKLSAQIAKIIELPDVKDTFTSQGIDPWYQTPEQFSALVKSDTVRFAQLIKAANIKGEQ
jgi:tripartite-type tricarboxylate transporter receptor subunit TctC